jgi:Zn-dependent M28 family amino/carboxypeptidase
MEGSSDHVSFASVGIPVLHFFTGFHADYHTLRDRVNRLNIDGLMSVIDATERLIRVVGDGIVTPVRRARP